MNKLLASAGFLAILFGCRAPTLIVPTAEIPAAPPAPSAVAEPPPGPARTIPRQDIFRKAALTLVRVSPDGKNLALLKLWKNRLNVFVVSSANPGVVKPLTFVKDREINDVDWKGNDNLIFELDPELNEQEHVFAVNVQSGTSRDLTPSRGVKATLVDLLDEVSETDILVGINEKNRDFSDVYRVNVQTGQTKLVAENSNGITTWLVDHHGIPRGGIATDGINSVFYLRRKPTEPMAEIFKTDFRTTFAPVAFTADDKRILVETNLGRDVSALVEIDPLLPAKKFITRTLYAHPKYDIGDARYSLSRHDVGVVSVVTDRSETHFTDPRDQDDWEFLRRQLGDMVLVDTSRNERLWVVKTLRDRTRGEYYTFARTKREITLIGQISPWLDPAEMAEMRTVHYPTRDGLEIEGYLTLPRGAEPRNLPVVVNPHGGPWARDEWHFSPEVQFLANRGFAVLQMNFRGSTGYGRKFWQASFKQWGGTMQNDITDGVRWLISQGVADPKRIAIYGGSYGGYAALAALTFTPELYACGVDYVGTANLFTFLKTIPTDWRPFLDMMSTLVGDPVKDKNLLSSVSPALHAEKIHAPLFVAQGKNDPRVPKAETDQMVENLRRRGVSVEYMVKNDEAHGFRLEENRFDFYRAIEKFLAKHLGGHP